MGKKWFGKWKIREWVALGLVVLMVGSSEVVVKAEDTEINPTGIFELIAEDTQYHVGDTVEIKLYAYDYPVESFDFYIDYDKEILEFQSEDLVCNNLSSSGQNLNWLIHVNQGESYEWEYNGRVVDCNIILSEQIAECGILSENGYVASVFFEVRKDFTSTTINFLDVYFCTTGHVSKHFDSISCTIQGTASSNSSTNTLPNTAASDHRTLYAWTFALSTACALGGYRVKKKYYN